MSLTLKGNPSLNDHMLRTQKLSFRMAITANATPASKVHTVDLPCIYLRTEGKTAAADAVENLTWTAAVDATNAVFGVLIDLGDNEASNVQMVRVTDITGTAIGTAIGVKGPNAATTATRWVTAGGNIAFEVTHTGGSLDSESPTYFVEIEYLEAR